MKNIFPIIMLLSFSIAAYAQELQEPGWHKPTQDWLDKKQVLQNVQLVEKNIQGTIKDQAVTITVTSTFMNPNQWPVEGTYMFTLPQDAHISGFKMLMGDKEQSAEILNVNKAREIYEAIVRKNNDPALLELVGYQLIKARVFPIPANQTTTIKVTLSTMARKDSGLVKFILPFVKTNMNKLTIDLDISSSEKLKTIYSPTHNINVSRKDVNNAKVSYEEKGNILDPNFTIYYSTSEERLGINFLTYKEAGEEGYFALMISPGLTVDKSTVLPKDIVFVLDKSGSMKGKKIAQAKEALKYCIDKLNEKDRFNIIDFQTSISSFNKSLIDATPKDIKDAISYVDAIEDGGGTNIDGALRLALSMLKKEEGRIAMIFFATDGLPTAEERNIEKIIANTKERNLASVRLFCFGVGYDVNTLLLDKISSDNRGVSDYVKPEEIIEEKVSLLYNKIQSPLFADIEVAFHGVEVTSIMPKTIPDIYKGMQLVIYGKYRKAGNAKVEIRGHMGKYKQVLPFNVDFPNEDLTNDYIPRLWAAQRIAFLLDQITMSGKEDKELVEEIIDLSKKFGIVTRYTAMLITEDNIQTDNGKLYGKYKEEIEKLNKTRANSGKGDQNLSKEAQEFKNRIDKFSASPKTSQMDEKKIQDALKDAENYATSQGQKLVKIKHVANKTFYLRNSVWTDSKYDEKDKEKVQKVKFGSNEYYKLAEDSALAKYLSVGEEAIVVYKGKIYQIEKEKQEK